MISGSVGHGACPSAASGRSGDPVSSDTRASMHIAGDGRDAGGRATHGAVAGCARAADGPIATEPLPSATRGKRCAQRPDGEIGRRKRLKISRGQPHPGSIPGPGTISDSELRARHPNHRGNARAVLLQSSRQAHSPGALAQPCCPTFGFRNNAPHSPVLDRAQRACRAVAAVASSTGRAR